MPAPAPVRPAALLFMALVVALIVTFSAGHLTGRFAAAAKPPDGSPHAEGVSSASEVLFHACEHIRKCEYTDLADGAVARVGTRRELLIVRSPEHQTAGGYAIGAAWKAAEACRPVRTDAGEGETKEENVM